MDSRLWLSRKGRKGERERGKEGGKEGGRERGRGEGVDGDQSTRQGVRVRIREKQ